MIWIMVALIDCNNFFVSCERAFQPKLAGMPVVVLSSNDGCVVSRSNEAKELGVPMGAPYFQIRGFFEKHNVKVFSSNFALYSDMSSRVMSVIEDSANDVQVYSIDEAFVRLSGSDVRDLVGLATRLRKKVAISTSIPVSVGIATTKTLAKAASKMAKNGNGVFVLGPEETDRVLFGLRAGEIWGIGPAMARKLMGAGVHTALELKNAPDGWIEKTLGVGGLRTVWELRGKSCLPLETKYEPKQSIRHSRSFGRKVESLSELEYATALHANRAAGEMREDGNAARFLSVFIGSSRGADRPVRDSATREFEVPAVDSRMLIAAARELVVSMYRKGFRYGRCGVMLGGFVPLDAVSRTSLFGENDFEKRLDLARVVDAINARFGLDTVRPASAYERKSFAPRRGFLSSCYTTNWSGLIVAKT